MADMESVCARPALLTRAAWRADLPVPFTRARVSKMIRLGALEGLTLRKVPGIEDEYYTRAEALLSRSCDVYDEVECLRGQGYHVLLPQDTLWPHRLYALGSQMPQFLFARGNLSLLSKPCVSVAGSRKVDQNTISIAYNLGKEIAHQRVILICGGAHGTDDAVQHGCLEAGGSLILVPTAPCDTLLRQKYLWDALGQGRLLILCDTWPSERFSAHRALARNHTIYALGEAAVVVASRNGTGGSWHGAVDCLRSKHTPVFVVCEEGIDFDGNRALLSLGAQELNGLGTVLQPVCPERGMDE